MAYRPPTRTPAPFKTCKVCGETKPRDEFLRRALTCKVCFAPIARERSRLREQNTPPSPPKPQKIPMRLIAKAPRRDQQRNPGASVKLERTLMALVERPEAEVLRAAAEYVRSQTWGETPGVVECLLASFGIRVEDRLTYLKGGGWQNRQHEGVYLPRVKTDWLFAKMDGRPVTRRYYVRLLTLLGEESGFIDLATWDDEISTSPEDVVDLFERAAKRAEST